MEFPVVLKKEHVEIPEVNWKKGEFPGVLKKNSCGISIGLGFWPWDFQEVSCNFAECPGVKVFFYRISKGKMTNLKFTGEVFRKVYLQTLWHQSHNFSVKKLTNTLW